MARRKFAGAAQVLSLTLAGLALSGCQGSEGPATPAAPAPPAASAVPSAPGGIAGGPVAFGMARLDIDLATGSADLTPLRSPAAIGDSYAVDVTGFFVKDPCIDCMRITGFGRVPNQANQLRVDIRLAHPFPGQNIRKDLDVFDPRVIVINAVDPLRQNYTFPNTPGVDTDKDGTPEILAGNIDVLANADGYTTHFDKRAEEVAGIALDGNLNPYKNYYTNLFGSDSQLFARNPNHRMAQNAAPETQSFHINYPPAATKLQYYLILEAAWGEAATKETRLIPTYYLPEFNMKEAFKVTTTDLTRSLTSVPASVTTLEISVSDWQAYGEVNPAYPDPARPDYLPGFSDATQVWVEAPDIAPLAFTTSTQVGGGIGQETNPWRFQVTVTNTIGTPAGSYPALVTVRDTRDGQVQSVEGGLSLGYTNDVRAYRIVNILVQDETTFQPATGIQNLILPTTHGAVPYANADAPGGDIAVFNNGAGSEGVLIPQADGSVINYYSKDYLVGPVVYGPGLLPSNDYNATNPHPSPASYMPVKHLDAADDGSYVLTFGDNNFTFNPNQIPNSILTRPLPMSDFAAFFINEGGVLLPAPRFIGGCGSGGTTLAPLFGEKMWNVWDNPRVGSFQNTLGYLSGGEATERCADTLDYYVFGSPYNSTLTRQVSGNANLLFDVPPATFFAELLAADAGTRKSDGTQALYVLVGGSLYQINSREGINAQNVAAPTPGSLIKRAILDSINDVGLEPVDLQVLEYNPNIPRNHAGIGQNSDWLVILYRDQGTGEGLIRIFETETFTLLQEIDSRSGAGFMNFYVTALDVDDFTYTIHVAMDDNGAAAGGNYAVSAFVLAP